MKKLLLLMLLALPAYGQEINPWGTLSYKERYYLYRLDDSVKPYLTRQFSEASVVSLVDARALALQGAYLAVQSSPDNTIFTYEDGDAVLYVSGARFAGTTNVFVQEFQADSGRVDVHNTGTLGRAAFSGYSTTVTVTADCISTDMIFVQPEISDDGPASEPLSVSVSDGSFTVHRPTGNEVSLPFVWRRFRQ